MSYWFTFCTFISLQSQGCLKDVWIAAGFLTLFCLSCYQWRLRALAITLENVQKCVCVHGGIMFPSLLELINTCDCRKVFWPGKYCQLYPFPLKTKARCWWVLACVLCWVRKKLKTNPVRGFHWLNVSFALKGNAPTLLTCWLLSATMLAACSHSNIVTRGGQKQEMRLMGMMLALQPQCFIVTFRRWLHMLQLRERLWSTSAQESPGRSKSKLSFVQVKLFYCFFLASNGQIP